MFAFFTTLLHGLLALGLNAGLNWAFHTEGYTMFTIYFVVLAYEHYNQLAKLSKMVIIDPDKLKDIMQEEKIKALKPMVGEQK